MCVFVSESVCVCACVCESERMCVRVYVCVCVGGGMSVCVCVLCMVCVDWGKIQIHKSITFTLMCTCFFHQCFQPVLHPCQCVWGGRGVGCVLYVFNGCIFFY